MSCRCGRNDATFGGRPHSCFSRAVSFSTWTRQARLPLRMGGCGLRDSRRTSVAAFWASWADALPTLQARFPASLGALALELESSSAPRCLQEANRAGRALAAAQAAPALARTVCSSAFLKLDRPPSVSEKVSAAISRTDSRASCAGIAACCVIDDDDPSDEFSDSELVRVIAATEKDFQEAQKEAV